MPLPTGAFNWGSWKPFYGTNKGSSLAAENEVTAQLLNPPSGTVSVARRLVVSPIDGTFSITDSAPSTNVQSRYLLAGSFSILEQTKRSVTLGQSQWNISLSFSLDSGNIGHVQINESKFSPLLGIEERCLELIIATPEDNISYTIKLEELDKNS
jgi:hypothetical protein